MAMLHLERSGKDLPLEGKAEFVLGRRDESTGSRPDIDLTTHGGAEAGVSRRHARIILLGGGLCYLADLGSTNGTLLNGRALEPLRYVRLGDGDRLELGELVVTFRS
jgi:pSer/pThr/pTyr-binding forkhead associated (FHA) protein